MINIARQPEAIVEHHACVIMLRLHGMNLISGLLLHHRDVIPLSLSGRAKQRSTPGLLRRLLDALVASRLQQTEHEIARYLESTGGKLTDTVEREIEERLYPRGRNRLF